MNALMGWLSSAAILLASGGCAKDSQEMEMSVDAFHGHFAAQRACKAFVDSLVGPAIVGLTAQRSVADMRSWIQEETTNTFAIVVREVQSASIENPVDPKSESDQLRLASALDDALRDFPGFGSSSCDSDVREYVMESLYLGMGGPESEVAKELRSLGITGEREQRWVMITSLLAGTLQGP